MLQKRICRLLMLWMLIIIFSSIFTIDLNHLRIGPNDDLKIFGWVINTPEKYMGVIAYCLINSVFRTINSNILSPWQINNIQDENKGIDVTHYWFAYEITAITTIYHWFDWYIYMNILLSQIDMVIIEISADVIISIWSTRRYLKNTNRAYEPLVQ